MQVNIFDYGMNGEGVAKIDGKIVLVPNALKDEDVEIELQTQHKNYTTAKLKSIVTPSPHRIEPTCPHKECGGCALRYMDYSEQLLFKQQLVKKTLKKIADIDVAVNPTVACTKQFNQRNKISFAVKDDVGFYQQNSHNLVPIQNCMLADNNINQVLTLFKQSGLNLKAEIKNLVVRSLENQVLVGVVTSKPVNLKPFYNLLSQYFNKVGLYQIKNTRSDSVVLTNNAKHIEIGRAHV